MSVSVRSRMLLFVTCFFVVKSMLLYAADERVIVHNTEEYPYNHIVMIGYDKDDDRVINAVGSGALVGPYMVLTAGHVVYNRSEGHYNEAMRYIIPGASRGGSSGTIMGSSSVAIDAPYGYRAPVRLRTNTGYANTGETKYDYGAVFIECPFRDLTVYMPLGFEYEPTYLQMSGYPIEDLPDNSYKYNQCFDGGDRLKIWDRVIAYDIYSSGGASGAPVWRSGDELVVAVNVTHSDDWDPYPGKGPRLVSQNEDLIGTWLEWEPEARTICPYYFSGVILESFQDIMEHLNNISSDKKIRIRDWNTIDAPNTLPEKHNLSVYQYIGGALFNWREYKVANNESDSPAFLRYIVLQKPVKKKLTREEANLLLTISATWEEEIPRNEEATTFDIAKDIKAIEMPVDDTIEYENNDQTIDAEYNEQ